MRPAKDSSPWLVVLNIIPNRGIPSGPTHNWGWFTNQLKNTHFLHLFAGYPRLAMMRVWFPNQGNCKLASCWNMSSIVKCWWVISMKMIAEYMDVTEFVLPTNLHKLNGSIRNLTIGNLFWTTQSGAVRVSQTGKVMRKMMIYQRILGPVFCQTMCFITLQRFI